VAFLNLVKKSEMGSLSAAMVCFLKLII